MQKAHAINLGTIDLEHVTQIWVRFGDSPYCLDTTGAIDTHDPLDRVGGPYRITSYVESDGDKWFLFAVVDSHFPSHDLVRGDSWEGAYETYIDWAADHRNIVIDENEIDDYRDGDDNRCNWTSSGTPVDTESIKGAEVTLEKIVTA